MAAAIPGLEQFQDIIDKLKPSIQSPNFESQLSSEAIQLGRAEKFLLKTELKRLGKPFKTAIDLREQVSDDVDPLEHEGLVHYLNLTGKTLFEKAMMDYGLYTVGVYEEVMAGVSGAASGKEGATPVARKEEPGTPVKEINFNQYHHREEERMNYSTQVEIIQQVTDNIQAMTQDISISGMRLKMDKKSLLTVGEKVPVVFFGLEKDFSIGLKSAVEYQVISVELTGEDKRVALRRTYAEQDDLFERFLKRFINGNKKRYRVNLDNTLEAVTAKTYEQFYLPRMMGLPLFIGKRTNQETCIHFAMLNDNNRGFYQYWKDEQGNNQLNHIFTAKRLEFLRKKAVATGNYECLLYTFSQVNKGKTLFFAALEAELKQTPGLFQQFLSYGAKKDSFTVLKLEIVPVDPEKCYLPLSMPETVSDAIKRANKPPTPRLMAMLKNLNMMVLMSDVTSDNGINNYARLPFDGGNTEFLKKQMCQQGKHSVYIESVRFKYQNLRSEDRYFYKTPVNCEKEGIDQDGITVDFSAKGLKIDFEEPYPFNIGSYVNVRFPELKALTDKSKIKSLMYRIVHINNDRTSISLSISEDHKRSSKVLFSDLLQSNRNRLKINGEQQELTGLDSALRTMFSSNLLHHPFFVQKDGADVITSFMGIPNFEHDLTNMFRLGVTNPRELNLHALTQSKISGVDFIEAMLRKMDRNSQPIYRELLVKVVPGATHLNEIYLAKFSDEFPADKDRVNFINRALSQGVFFALRVYLSRTVRPDTDFISAEMSYINHYAQHRGKALEEELWQVIGVGEVLDVTQEVLTRYKFSPKQIVDIVAKRKEALAPAEPNEI